MGAPHLAEAEVRAGAAQEKLTVFRGQSLHLDDGASIASA